MAKKNSKPFTIDDLLARAKANPKEAEALKAAIEARLFKHSYYEFFKAAVQVLEPTTKWQFNWHNKYICDLLQSEGIRIKSGLPKDKDIVINISPRSGKSYMTTVIFPVWMWLVFPECKIMSISHTERLAFQHAHQSKILIESPWFKERYPELTIRFDSNSKSEYTNNKGGTRLAFGLSAGIVGQGADIIICDDLNNPNDVSTLLLENVSSIYKETIYSRLNDPSIGLRLIIQQRTHKEDISSYLLDNLPFDHRHICIPAKVSSLISPPELADYYEDGFYWKGRFGEKVLDTFNRTQGSRAFAAQFLQNPVPDEGGIIKKAWLEANIKEPAQLPNLSKLTYHLFIDSAYTDKTQNDPTAILVVAKMGNMILVRDSITVRYELPGLLKEIQRLWAIYCGSTSRIFIEPKASGKSIFQALKSGTGLNVKELTVTRDSKLTRVTAISAYLESMRVQLYKGNWNAGFIDECTSFPFGKHDDQLDCLVYAINQLIRSTSTLNYAHT